MQCTNNLKQLITAVGMYESDYGWVPVWSGGYGSPVVDGKLASYGVTRDLGICPSDPTESEDRTRRYWYGETSYGYVVLSGLLEEYGVKVGEPLASRSPLFFCRCHEKQWHVWIVGHYDGSVTVERSVRRMGPEFDKLGPIPG